jgi:patatin-like phospholipase/acyl hydrolase
VPAKELIKVLSIDGGGIRGIIPAVVLAAIEEQTGRPACELFDLIAGTSTGGIIALGLTVPGEARPGGGTSPRWSAHELVGMYESEGPKIFHRSLLRTIETVDGLLATRYAATGLEVALEYYMGDARLSQALTDVLIPSYDIYGHEPFFFKSFTPTTRPAATLRQGAADRAAATSPAPSPSDFPMRVVGRGTSAAPTYFEPEDVHAPTTPGGGHYVLVDGGTFANNPAMCAYAEVARNHSDVDVLIVSLGTGRPTEAAISFKQAKRWGLACWAQPLLGVIMDGASAAVDYQLDELLGADRRHFRFQTKLEGVSDSLDDASPSNIAGLRKLAEDLVAAERGPLEEVCELLRSP